MSAIMEMLAVRGQHPARHREEAVRQVREQNNISPAIARKRPVEQWSSSLDPQDLQCLLALLEGHVLPQLLAAYSPSAVSPVDQLRQPVLSVS